MHSTLLIQSTYVLYIVEANMGDSPWREGRDTINNRSAEYLDTNLGIVIA